MTEVELIKKMESCREHKDECDDKQCRDTLIRDALAIIKMQKERLEALVNTMNEQQAQIDGLNRLLAKKYTEEQLAAVVNNIITVFCDDEWCLDDAIDAVQTFMMAVGMNGHVRIGLEEKIPRIVLNK